MFFETEILRCFKIKFTHVQDDCISPTNSFGTNLKFGRAMLVPQERLFISLLLKIVYENSIWHCITRCRISNNFLLDHSCSVKN